MRAIVLALLLVVPLAAQSSAPPVDPRLTAAIRETTAELTEALAALEARPEYTRVLRLRRVLDNLRALAESK